MSASSFAAGAVVYAKDVSRVSLFYAEVAGLHVTEAEQDHVVLGFESVETVLPEEGGQVVGREVGGVGVRLRSLMERPPEREMGQEASVPEPRASIGRVHLPQHSTETAAPAPVQSPPVKLPMVRQPSLSEADRKSLIAEYGGGQFDATAPVVAALVAQHGEAKALEMLQLSQALFVARSAFSGTLDFVYHQFVDQYHAKIGYSPSSGESAPTLPPFDANECIQLFCEQDSPLARAISHMMRADSQGLVVGSMKVSLGGYEGAVWRASQFERQGTGAEIAQQGELVLVGPTTQLDDPGAVWFDNQLGLVTSALNVTPPPPSAPAAVLAQVDALLSDPLVAELAQHYKAPHSLATAFASQQAAYYGRDRFFRLLDLQAAYPAIRAAKQSDAEGAHSFDQTYAARPDLLARASRLLAVNAGENNKNAALMVLANTGSSMMQIYAGKFGSSSRIVNSAVQAGVSVGASEGERWVMQSIAETKEMKEKYSTANVWGRLRLVR